MKTDFLSLSDLPKATLDGLLDRALFLKNERRARRVVRTLEGRTLVLLFEKASTRTRVSFEAAILQLGGHAITLPIQDSQLNRGEPLEDTARVISRYADAIMYRTFGEDRLRTFAKASTVPVINGLSDGSHPVQLLADVLTIRERFGSLQNRRVVFVGDGSSNMAASWIEAAGLFGFELIIACPKAYAPKAAVLRKGKGKTEVMTDVKRAVKNAEVVATDVWTSMGQEAESAQRRAVLGPYQVDAKLMKLAAKNAIVLHCLPAHRDEEITGEVLESAQSAVWDEAENRLHVQKALLETLILPAAALPLPLPAVASSPSLSLN